MVQSAVTALTDSIADAEALTKLDVTSREPDRQAAVLRAIRWLEMTRGGVSPELREDLIRKSLTSGHPEVRRLAVRWAAEAGLKSLADDVRKMLERTDLTTTEFAEIVAAISFIESGSASPKARDPGRETLLTELVTSSNLSPTVRALALRSLPTEATASMEADLLKWFQETSDRGFRREIVTCLAISKRDSALEALAKLLDQAPRGQRDLDLEVRGDLLAALAPAKDKYKDLLQRFANDAQQPALAEEAKRSLASGSKYDDTPSLEDVRGWWKLVGMGGDASRGRRVFMRSQCVNCHAYHGRGSTLGPELSTLHATTPRQRIFESVLMPSREIAPLFATWKILTVDGRVLTGAKLNGGGVGTNLKYLAADGTTFELPLADIENQELSSVSIMPADLMKTLTVEEIRDLLAFLE